MLISLSLSKEPHMLRLSSYTFAAGNLLYLCCFQKAMWEQQHPDLANIFFKTDVFCKCHALYFLKPRKPWICICKMRDSHLKASASQEFDCISLLENAFMCISRQSVRWVWLLIWFSTVIACLARIACDKRNWSHTNQHFCFTWGSDKNDINFKF